MLPFPEPDVASSDAINMECTLRRDEDNYVIHGKKWWSSGMSVSLSYSYTRRKTATDSFLFHLGLNTPLESLIEQQGPVLCLPRSTRFQSS